MNQLTLYVIAICLTLVLAGCTQAPSAAPRALDDMISDNESNSPFVKEATEEIPTEDAEIDEGEKVQRIDVSTRAVNQDADSSGELLVKVSGVGHDDFEHYKFEGRMNYSLTRNAGDLRTENWIEVKNGSFEISPDDFKNELFPSFQGMFDDESVINEEKYRLSFTVIVGKTGEMFSDVEEFMFLDDAESQPTPERMFPDEGASVIRIEISTRDDNRDGDFQKELIVKITGENAEEDKIRFAGTARILLEKEEGSFGEETFSQLKEWTLEFGPNNFTSSFQPAVEFVIDDTDLQADEKYQTYRVTVFVTLAATGEELSDRDNSFYSTE